jgi:hypothetical protein
MDAAVVAPAGRRGLASLQFVSPMKERADSPKTYFLKASRIARMRRVGGGSSSRQLRPLVVRLEIYPMVKNVILQSD